MNKTAYNPHYDPLLDSTPGHNSEYADSYWKSTIDEFPEDDGALKSDIQTDVVIIGSGFTGLSTALFLAREYNIKAIVLEANQVAWGCTSRNGGQGLLSTGRLSREQWVKKWGEDTAKKLHTEIIDSFHTFKELVYDDDIKCEPQGNGYLHIAHRKSEVAKFIKGINIDNNIFNYKSHFIEKKTLKQDFVDENGAHGALFEPIGIGVNPLKLAFGYMKIARKHGAKIHPSSPVTDWQKKDGYHYLVTPGGTVKAKTVAVATGGYTSSSLHTRLAYRYMPILSNSVASRVLTDEEIKACNFKTRLTITDSRILRFYYRLLPDNRLQIGTRSAITGKSSTNNRHYKLLINGMYHKFPILKNIKIDYSWWGWVDVSHDMMPRVVQMDTDKQVFYAFGYGGHGVSFSAQAGKRMAQRIAGVFDDELNKLPIYSSQLPKHPLTHIRRIGQTLLYKYYNALDKLP